MLLLLLLLATVAVTVLLLLPLLVLQNLNFTGFRKILKKHDKILETSRGADWRVVHVEVAPFYTCKKITQLISETEVRRSDSQLPDTQSGLSSKDLCLVSLSRRWSPPSWKGVTGRGP